MHNEALKLCKIAEQNLFTLNKLSRYIKPARKWT